MGAGEIQGLMLACWLDLPGLWRHTGQQIQPSLAFIKWPRSSLTLPQLLSYLFKSLSLSCHFPEQHNQLYRACLYTTLC